MTVIMSTYFSSSGETIAFDGIHVQWDSLGDEKIARVVLQTRVELV